MKRVAWLSNNLFGYELLKEALRLNFSIVAILLSGGKMYDPAPAGAWESLEIPTYPLNSSELADLDLDLVVMCGCRQLLSKEFLSLPKQGIVGFHPTLLPYGRGNAPIINTILQNLSSSGVTLFQVDEGIDTGDIIAQEFFRVEPDDYAQDIYDKVIDAGRRLVPSILSSHRTPQGPGYIFPKITHADNEIKDSDSAEIAYRKVRAFSKPYDGAYIQRQDKRLVIWQAELL